MPLPIMGALTAALTGGSILQGVQQSKEQKKVAEQQEEASERQEELIKEQNRKLERIAERARSNPQAGVQAAALIQQRQYSIGGIFRLARMKAAPMISKMKASPIVSQAKPLMKDIAKAGNAAFGDGIASNIATDTVMGVTGYGVGKVIQHDMKKNNLDVDENGTMYQKSYSVLSGIGTAFKAVNKSFTPKVVSSLKKPSTWLIGAGIGAAPTALGYIADKSQMEEQANATRQQRQYSAVGSIFKGGLNLVKGKAIKAGQGVANWTKPIRTHTMQTITGTASNLASFGLAGTKNVQKFGEALSKGNSEIARNAGNWIKNHKTAANAISILPGAAVAGVTFDGVSNAINKTGKIIDPGAYKYQDSKEQKVE